MTAILDPITRTDRPALADRFLQVVADRDTDALVALFPDRGVVNDWGIAHAGPGAIRAWSEREFLGADVTLDVSRVSVVDGRTVIVAAVASTDFTGPSTFVLIPAGPDSELVRELVITA